MHLIVPELGAHVMQDLGLLEDVLPHMDKQPNTQAQSRKSSDQSNLTLRELLTRNLGLISPLYKSIQQFMQCLLKPMLYLDLSYGTLAAHIS